MQNRNSLRLIAAAIVALLVAYLRMTGYLPESGQGTSYEDQTEADSEYEPASEVHSAEESEYESASEVHSAEENEQEQSSAQTRDGFCRTTYEVFVYSFCDSDGDGIGDLPGLLSKLDYINDGDPAGGRDLGMTGLWLMPVFRIHITNMM